tara:strand:+ start:258 stop:470 length:213 start_codon:yes stop_codon:yes gene_type:complete
MKLEIIALLNPDGFDKRFWDLAKESKTYKQAYEELEKEYILHFKKRRYADYNSYRNCRDKRLKKANKLHT